MAKKSTRKVNNRFGKIPTLKAEEELNLLKISRYGSLNENSKSVGDSKRKANALKLLVHHNRNLVDHIVRGFYTGGYGDESREEFLSVGIMSILKAIDKFDLNSKKRFATYAGYWMKQAMQHALSKNQIINQYNPLTKKEEKGEGDENEKKKFVKPKYRLVLYDKKHPSSNVDCKSYSLIDIISCKEDDIEEQTRRIQLRIHSNKIVSSLDQLENLIIRLYFGILPMNLFHIKEICKGKEVDEIELIAKKRIFKKKKIEEINVNEVIDNKIVKKYVHLFSEQHKTKEIGKIIGKADGVVRKLRQKAIKKMKIFGKNNNLDTIV